MRDQIAFCAFHSFFVDVGLPLRMNGMLTTRMRRMPNNNLKIRIAG